MRGDISDCVEVGLLPSFIINSCTTRFNDIASSASFIALFGIGLVTIAMETAKDHPEIHKDIETRLGAAVSVMESNTSPLAVLLTL